MNVNELIISSLLDRVTQLQFHLQWWAALQNIPQLRWYWHGLTVRRYCATSPVTPLHSTGAVHHYSVSRLRAHCVALLWFSSLSWLSRDALLWQNWVMLLLWSSETIYKSYFLLKTSWSLETETSGGDEREGMGLRFSSKPWGLIVPWETSVEKKGRIVGAVSGSRTGFPSTPYDPKQNFLLWSDVSS